MKHIIILIASIAIIVAGATTYIARNGSTEMKPITITKTVTQTTPVTITPTVVIGDPTMSTDLRFTFTITSPTLNGFELFWDEACTQEVPIDEDIVVGVNGEIQLDSWWTASIFMKNVGGGSILFQSSYTDSSYYGYITNIAPANGQVEPGGVVEFTATIFVTSEAIPGETHTAVVSIVAS